MYSAGHLYLGTGLHAALRIALSLIEMVSSSFRCASLTLRTVCNAVAGHVLLAVLMEMTLSGDASILMIATASEYRPSTSLHLTMDSAPPPLIRLPSSPPKGNGYG